MPASHPPSTPSGAPGILASRMPAIDPDIIRRQVVIGAAALSPDGGRVVYTRRTVVAGRYQTSLWLVPYSGGRPRRLTNGRWNDTAPAWSPDGGAIAFASDRGGADAKAALFLIHPDGGEAERICGADRGDVGAPVWSPDGRRIAFTAEAGPPRFWVGDPARRTARVIREVDWRSDEGSGSRDYRTHLHVVAARAGARPVQVTRGDFDVAEPAWHPDGRRIAFASTIAPDADLNPKPSIYSVRVAGGKAEAAGRARGPRPAARVVARRPHARVRRHRHSRSAQPCRARAVRVGRERRPQPDRRARPAGDAGVGLRPARLDGARAAAALLGRTGAARPDQPARARRGLASAARRRPASADDRRHHPRGGCRLERARDRDHHRRRVSARGVRGRARPAAAADAPWRGVAAAVSATRRVGGGCRRCARLPVRAPRRRQALGAGAGAARRARTAPTPPPRSSTPGC